MPQKKSAAKEIRKSKKRHLRNTGIRSELHTLIRKLESFIAQNKKAEATEYLKMVSARLQRAAQKGVIHPNRASRKISRLSKRLAT
ncbi:MAG: 30S ribosomal protein S20 [Candidatus Omnitrophica bacterium]|nr:30S ribosomal protein S20 [Candidatus Omnitrophota bacterium]